MGGTHFLQTGYLLLNRNAPHYNLTAWQSVGNFQHFIMIKQSHEIIN